ncbi:MAG: hypothetical protein ACOVQX_05500 [Legionella sp.]
MPVIAISDRTQQLIEQINAAELGNYSPFLTYSGNQIEQLKIIRIMSYHDNFSHEMRFLFESLRAALLDDWHKSFLSEEERRQKESAEETNWSSQLLIFMLACAGTLVAICEGFDSVTTIFSMFNAVPVVVVGATGVLFSLLSIVVFYGFDLIAIYNNLGVHTSTSPQLIDVFVEQLDHINSLKSMINRCYLKAKTIEKLQEYKYIVEVLVSRYHAIAQTRETYREQLNNPWLYMTKLLVTVLTGMLFFGTGFYLGQSISMAVVGLLIPMVSTTMLSVVLSSFTVACASFSLYWYVERPGLESLVDRWYGLDQETIDKLINETECGVEHLSLLLSQMDIKIEQIRLSNLIHQQSPAVTTTREPEHRSHHFFSTHRRSYSDGDLGTITSAIDAIRPMFYLGLNS